MVNWMKAALLELMGIDVCVECVRTPSRSRHLTAVKELRCKKENKKRDKVPLLRCFPG